MRKQISKFVSHSVFLHSHLKGGHDLVGPQGPTGTPLNSFRIAIFRVKKTHGTKSLVLVGYQTNTCSNRGIYQVVRILTTAGAK